MPKGRTGTRSAKEKTEHAAGVIRALEKRLRESEREVARLLKFINAHDYELSDETEEVSRTGSKKRTCKQPKCGSTKFFFLEIPNKTGIKRFYTCKSCGKRESENVRPVDT